MSVKQRMHEFRTYPLLYVGFCTPHIIKTSRLSYFPRTIDYAHISFKTMSLVRRSDKPKYYMESLNESRFRANNL